MTIKGLEFGASLEDIIEELRSQLRLNHIDYFEKKPKESGNNIQIQCPYHGNGLERKPSAGIHKDTGIFHCFACGETHDLPEVISYCFGKNDLGAFGWGWLLQNFLTIQVEERKDVVLDFSRSNKIYGVDRISDNDSNSDRQFVSEEELDRYRYYHPYWTERGVTDKNIIEIFDLGYDINTHSITFPVRDIEGNCLFVARRSVRSKFFNYPEGVTKPLYGLYELHELAKMHGGHFENEIIIVESMIDCILLWQAGHYSVALNGLGNKFQMNQLTYLPCRKLILATDNDKAGYDARDRIKKFVDHKIFTEINYPDGVKDPGDMTEDERRNILDWETI